MTQTMTTAANTKPMKSDKKILAEIRSKLEGIFGDNKSSVNYQMKSIGGIVKLENGMLLIIRRKAIRTSFQFGYGMGDSFEHALQTANTVGKEWDYFHARNMHEFHSDMKWLLNREPSGIRRISNYRNGAQCDICEINVGVGKYTNEIGEPTEADWNNIVAEVKRMEKEFEKQLAAYWKKYSDKISTDVYDETR